jgi:hypothetical protein
MKTKAILSLIFFALVCVASLRFTQSAASSPANDLSAASRAARERVSFFMPVTTTLNVDRTDDNAAASACTGAANDCSLRGAIIKANADLTANSFVISLQASTTYNLTLANATQENAAATGDLDITTTLHSVTIAGGGPSTIINAAGLNTGSMRDRAFQITGAGVTVVFQDLKIENGIAADGGNSGVSTNPTAQNNPVVGTLTPRAGGGILNNGGSVTLTNVTIQSCQVVGKGDTVLNDHTTLDAHGGGLASLGTGSVMITGSTFTGNSAVGGNGGNFNNGQGANASGGSIYFEGGTLNIDGSGILNSAATGGQGGSVSQNGMENGGFGGTAQGGGVWIGGGTTTINNTTFENTAANAGSSGTGGNGSEPGAEANGGGLYGLGNVTVSNSTFHLATATGGNTGNTFGTTCVGGHTSGDAGAARGGAIYVETNFSVASSSLVVDTSTFNGNSATGGNGGNGGQTDGGLNCGANGAGGLAYGGAITNGGAATLNIKHSTISGNSAQAGNTGVAQSGSTKPARDAAEGTGGGIRVGSGAVTIENTIIAGNTAANGAGANPGAFTPGPDVDGTVTSNGHNLLQNTAEASGFTGTGEVTGVSPNLAALADNQGPTKTMALNPGSPAIDAGVASGATKDQRGLLRTYDDPTANAATSDGTDIGAFELQPLCSMTCPTSFSVSNDPDQCGANVTFTPPSDSACGTITCDHNPGDFFAVGNTTVTCTSTAGPSCSFTVTVNDTQPPAITAPPDASYQCASEVPLANPSQATASDNCGTPGVTVSESSSGAGSPSSPLIITRIYKATDGASLTASATQTITVIDNTAPSISCPANIVANAVSGTCAAPVTFTVAASDNCSVPTVITSAASGSSFPVGVTTVIATATDAAGNSSTCSFTVTVKDVDAPAITLNGQTISLWPPNHKYTTVQVTDLVTSASDLCDPSVNINSVRIAQVTSDEPDNSGGDGNTTHDIVIAGDCKSVQLRSERMGGSNGRVYTITFKVTDSSGNSSTATAKVVVDHSQNGSGAVDDGPHFTVVSSCP